MKLAHVAALATIRALRIAFLLPISAVAEASRLTDLPLFRIIKLDDYE